jgi:DNA-binding transcriptional ArsR family regulator
MADAAADRLRVYAQPQRLMILSRLLSGECTVSEIDAATGIGQPALSQQLAELRRAEVVRTRRESKQVFYRLADEKVSLCVKSIEAMFGASADAAVLLETVLARPVPRLADSPHEGAATFVRVCSNEA